MTAPSLRLAALILSAVIGLSSLASAGPLDPNSFASLGSLALTDTARGYTLDTTGDVPTLTGAGVSFTGVVSGGVAVFVFDSVSIAEGVTLFATTAFQSLPIAILSRSDVSIAGTLDVSAFANLGGAGANFNGLGRPGSQGEIGYGPDQENSGPSGGGGGGSAGAGGKGGDVSIPGVLQVDGGRGRDSIPGLADGLRAGTRGARGGIGPESFAGGGGGAIEIGALGSISIAGEVLAFGGFGLAAGSGGGGGGGIYLHAPTVSLLGGVLDVGGGAGGDGLPYQDFGYFAGGGGGGGGEILIEAGRFDDRGGTMFAGGGFGGLGYPDGSGGGDGAAGEDGRVTVSVAVPEPGSLALASIPLAAGLARLIRGRNRSSQIR